MHIIRTYKYEDNKYKKIKSEYKNISERREGQSSQVVSVEILSENQIRRALRKKKKEEEADDFIEILFAVFSRDRHYEKLREELVALGETNLFQLLEKRLYRRRRGVILVVAYIPPVQNP